MTSTDDSAAVTVASSPHPQTLTLALRIQPQPTPSPNSDAWTDVATSALIDAWGELYLQLGRGHLKQHHWQQIAAAVSRPDAQCKNRIDALKKRYKSEKSKITSGQSPLSTWPFFHRLDILIGPTLLLKPPLLLRPHPTPPPALTNHLPKRCETTAADDDNGGGWAELTRAVARFGEVYERTERAKASWAVEMERARMGFVRELETQRMEFFVKTQMELSRAEKAMMLTASRERKRPRRSSAAAAAAAAEEE